MTRKFITFTTSIFAIVAIIAIVICVPANGANITRATAFRTSDNSDFSRFVVDLSQKPEYQITTLKNPQRILITIKNATWDNFEDIPKHTKLINGVRHLAAPNSELQLVLDIKTPFIIQKHFLLPPKDNIYRLVLDIVAKQNSGMQPVQLQQNVTIFTPIPHLKEVTKTIIAIDAGHGGHDPGTIGYHGSKEKIITLAYAYAIKNELENTGRYKVILTRKNDTYIDLKKRVAISRQAKANMFLSIHADAHNNRIISGLSVYTLSEKASDKEAEALAWKENNAGVLNNVDVAGDTKDVTELLIDLVQRETKNLSADFAENIISEIQHETEVLHNNPHRFAGFRVLTAPDIPSALVELGYLSNKKEERMLLSEIHRKKLAEAIVRAIDKHFKQYPVN